MQPSLRFVSLSRYRKIPWYWLYYKIVLQLSHTHTHTRQGRWAYFWKSLWTLEKIARHKHGERTKREIIPKSQWIFFRRKKKKKKKKHIFLAQPQKWPAGPTDPFLKYVGGSSAAGGDPNCNRILCSGFISTAHPVAAPCKRYYRLLAEDSSFLGSDVMSLGAQYPMFRRIVVPSSSECSSPNHHSVSHKKSREQYNQEVYVTQGLLQLNTKMLTALLKFF